MHVLVWYKATSLLEHTRRLLPFLGYISSHDCFFGPKRAPSYFQEIMATVVLTGLIYMICERYIDDCTVFDDTNIEFVSRLKLIFERFRKHNLYIKASKCLFGCSELELVGKVVSEKGLQISRTKIQSCELIYPRKGNKRRVCSSSDVALYHTSTCIFTYG